MGLDVYIHFLRFCINDSLLVICRLQFTDIYENSNRPLQHNIAQVLQNTNIIKYEGISWESRVCSRGLFGVFVELVKFCIVWLN